MVLPSVMYMRAFWDIQANVRQYYQQFEEQQTQSLIDQKVKEHLGQTTAAALARQQVGGAVYSHLTTLGVITNLLLPHDFYGLPHWQVLGLLFWLHLDLQATGVEHHPLLDLQ